MPSKDARRQGQRAERAAARKYGLSVATSGPDYYDLLASNGTRYQCKSAVYETLGGNEGVFRVRKEHLERLEQKRSAFILVLFPSEGSDSTTPLKISKVSTNRVRSAVDHWYPQTQHYEIPWSNLLSYP